MIDPSRTSVIVNPRGAGGRVGREWPRTGPAIERALGPVEWLFTEQTGHATALAKDAVARGRTTLLVVGGDGSLGEVVDGVMASGAPPGSVTVGLLPAGTGGDFKRLLVARKDPVEAANALASASSVVVDVGRATFTTDDGSARTRGFMNLASFGMSALVCTHVNRSSKRLGGKLTFAICTLQALASWRPSRARILVDGADLGEHLLGTATVANGQYAGGSMWFAPGARLSDGAFDVTIIPEMPPLTSVRHLGRLYDGGVASVPGVSTGRGRRIEALPLDDARPIGIELDGEPVGRLPATIEVVPGAIRFLGVRAEAV